MSTKVAEDEMSGTSHPYLVWAEKTELDQKVLDFHNAVLDLRLKSTWKGMNTNIENSTQAGVDGIQSKSAREDFNLPDQWSGTLAKNKEEVILWTIGFTYQINEPGSLFMLPSLRTVAEEIEAPYSILMDCYKLFHGDKDKKDEVKDKIKAIGQKVRTKFLDFIKSKGKEWRREWLLEDEPDLYSLALEDIKEDYVISITQVALNDIKGIEIKCGDEIESDIRGYFKAELQEIKDLIQKK